MAPVKREVPLKESRAERCLTTRAFLHSSIKALGIRAPTYQVSPATKGPLQRGMPASRNFLNISSRVPSGEAPPRPPTEPLQRERHFLHRAPFIYILGSLVDEPSSRFPKNGAAMKRDARLQTLFYIFIRFPSGGALPPGSLHRAPTERDAPPLEPLSAISQSPQ
jgi:hypothetical protein